MVTDSILLDENLTDARREDMAAWSQQTSASHSLRMFPGGHFYLLEPVRLLHELSRQLDRIVAVTGTLLRADVK